MTVAEPCVASVLSIRKDSSSLAVVYLGSSSSSDEQII